MARIAWDDLPDWAQSAIRNTSPGGMTQITRDSGSLSIVGGVARYNGKEVAPEGVVVTEAISAEETIAVSALPGWARAKVYNSIANGGQVQTNNNGNVLSITRSGAYYNGKRVVLTTVTEE